MILVVDHELRRAGISVVRMDWTSGARGTHVARFVGRSLHDLARFLAWSDAAGVTVGEAGSEEGQSLNVDSGRTLIGVGRRRTPAPQQTIETGGGDRCA